jgi:hypothetical protein
MKTFPWWKHCKVGLYFLLAWLVSLVFVYIIFGRNSILSLFLENCGPFLFLGLFGLWYIISDLFWPIK